MSNEPYLLITADTHAGGTAAQYREYLDPRYRPRFDEWSGGHGQASQEPRDRNDTRNWDHAVRAGDQDGQGVVGEVVYPNTVPPFFEQSVLTAPPPTPDRYELALAGVRAHNRWLRDFCAEDPERRAGIGLILPNDFDDAVHDIGFIAEAGLRGGVLLPLVPPDCHWVTPLYDPSWDRVLAAIQDHGLVINQHAGQGSPHYGTGPVPEAVWLSEILFYGRGGWRQLLMSGAFEKFPKLRYVVTESGCAWAPPALRWLDRIHRGFETGGLGELEYSGIDWVLKEPPSVYAARNCYYGASFPGLADLAGIDAIGEDHVLWGNDYPHKEGTFPYNTESLRLTFGRLPEARRRKVLGLNAAALYGFDVDRLTRRARALGPTPEEVNTPLPREEIPADSRCELFVNPSLGA